MSDGMISILTAATERIETRGDLLRAIIEAMIELNRGEGVGTAQTYALAAAIGPFLADTMPDGGGGQMLRITFSDDGSEFVMSPDAHDNRLRDGRGNIIELSEAARETLASYRRGMAEMGRAIWLPPSCATPEAIAELKSAKLLKLADPPNTDCYMVTDRGLLVDIPGVVRPVYEASA